ncbi:hypothetical protein AQUCO_03100088v1 [Aquilegia coerulea]|uniref:Uncharacterized protein n=1 Tax=Aquilegia coerulea TaxID=218851 RepID=A0A2G5D0P7_AQUCA|nr:hypothetical protein AQUCO_03100088v1 [Aquilegia coerulea]
MSDDCSVIASCDSEGLILSFLTQSLLMTCRVVDLAMPVTKIIKHVLYQPAKETLFCQPQGPPSCLLIMCENNPLNGVMT